MDTSMKVALAATVGVLVGGVAGYFAGRQVAIKQFEDQLDAEVERIHQIAEQKGVLPGDTHKHYNEFTSEELDSIDDDLVESTLYNKPDLVQYHKISSRYAPADDSTPPDDEVAETSHIYILKTQEYLENVSDFPQSTLTWYEDQAVINEDGRFIVQHEDLIGSGEPPFGQGSDEPHVVYIRNTRKEEEYEVLRGEGTANEIMKARSGD